MTKSTRHSFSLHDTYLQLTDGGAADRIEVDADFWPQIGKRPELHEGRLMGALEMSADSPTWEMHPAGDEFLYLLKGAAEVVLQDINGERVIELKPKEGCLVPRGLWHRILVRAPALVLFVTPGKGTQNRPVLEG